MLGRPPWRLATPWQPPRPPPGLEEVEESPSLFSGLLSVGLSDDLLRILLTQFLDQFRPGP